MEYNNQHSPQMEDLPANIVFFDGVCNVCDGLVTMLLDIDHRKALTFASLQGDTYIRLAKTFQFLPQTITTLVFYSSGKWYVRSEAIIRLLATLGGVWNLWLLALIIPQFLRDTLYSIFAKNRYRWFGVRSSCTIPTPEVQERFLP